MNHAANLSIILVEPQGPLNIGSVCRTMQNFGCNDLRLVNPRTDHLSEAAQLMAVKAGHILKEAKVFPDIGSAVADINLLFGTTRRFGKRYRETFMAPDQAAVRINSSNPVSRCGLLFGREDKGLTNEELDRCHHFIAIPTSGELASLNLAQAVNICLYEIYQQSLAEPNLPVSEWLPAPAEELEGMLQHMRTSLFNLGFFKDNNPDHILHTFRRIFGRTELNSREVSILRGLWNCLDKLAATRKSDKAP
ncbi:MAG: RNA methyltransferase [Thermodesulfobacteriota bacterium]